MAKIFKLNSNEHGCELCRMYLLTYFYIFIYMKKKNYCFNFTFLCVHFMNYELYNNSQNYNSFDVK